MSNKTRPGKALRPLAGQWTPATFGEAQRLRETVPYFHGLWRRNVQGGQLRAILSEDRPGGWHLSVSFTPSDPVKTWRYPTWDELADARYTLAPTNRDFVMHLPPPAQYVNVHDTCFHLHENPPAGYALVETEDPLYRPRVAIEIEDE
jgi:hypothetical protein